MRGKPVALQPGYHSLVTLVDQLEYLPGPRRYPDCLTQRSLAAILEWCQQYGPLGVLLARWESISLAPQQQGVGRWSQQRYIKAFGQIIQVQTATGDVQDRRGMVSIHGLDDLTQVEESASKNWGRFFPSVEVSKRDAFPYPQPYTANFCHLYGEPLSDFCKAAQLLAGAISHLSRTQPEINGDQRFAREQALDTINVLRPPVTSVLDFEDNGTIKARRVAPTLLASFAEMFGQDLLYGRLTLQCTCCGKAFVSSAYQAQYCSVTCRLRRQKRRLRAQMKQAKALRAQGQSLRQIAALLHQPRAIVKGWLGSAKSKAKANTEKH